VNPSPDAAGKTSPVFHALVHEFGFPPAGRAPSVRVHVTAATSSNPAAPRATLKLKIGARRPPREIKTPATPRAQNNSTLKPGAHWSDEYKERMQADMDALISR
jgi:hypothetical protein